MSDTRRFCTNCGSALESDDHFCPSCGHQAGPWAPSTTTSEPATIPTPPPTSQPATIPTLAGRFTLEGVLGRGAAGTVYLAHDALTGEEVALKSLEPVLFSDVHFRERFRVEAATLASLAHPNVVEVRAFVEDDQGAYLAMERVEGPSLRQLLAAYDHLAPEQACGVLCGALAGLGFAHEQGLLHGDVKPENLLVDQAGISKLSDFGQAVPLGSSASGGSTPYLSPEALRGDALDQRSDLYAMGAVLYECLSGRPPFVADQPATLVHRALNEDPAPIEHMPQAMSALVAASLAKDPAGRPQSARAFLDALTEAARRSYGEDWATRAGVSALAAALGLGVLGALEAGSQGAPTLAATAARATTAAHATAPLEAGAQTSQIASTAVDTPAPVLATGAKKSHWLTRTIGAHKVVAATLAALVVVGAVAGVVVASGGSKPSTPASATAGAAGATKGSTPAKSVTATSGAAQAATASWSEVATAPSATGLQDVVCPAVEDCLALAETDTAPAGGNSMVYAGGTWSSPEPVADSAASAGVGGYDLLSCPTKTFCAMVTTDGTVWFLQNGTWTVSDQISPSGSEDEVGVIACADVNNCLAIDGGELSSYEDGTWSPPSQVPSVIDLDISGPAQLTCATPTFCVLVGSNGYAFTYSNGTWSSGTPLDVAQIDAIPAMSDGGPDALTSVSCPNTTFCVAVDVFGYAYVYAHGTWGAGEKIGGGQPSQGSGGLPLQSVSCPTTTFCLAVDSVGDAAFYRNGTWSNAATVVQNGSASTDSGPAFTAVSCASADWCLAVGSDSSYLYSNSSSTAVGGQTSPHGGGSSGGGSAAGGTGSGAGPNRSLSPKATVLAYLKALGSDFQTACHFISGSGAAACLDASSADAAVTVTDPEVHAQIVQGNEALVSFTGRICASSGGSGTPECASVSNPDAGMPAQAGSFAQAYAAALGSGNAGPGTSSEAAVPLIEENGVWYLNGSSS